MAGTPGQTIIIKKIKKGGEGYHGGAWKLAYADFVTAMMAFFLILWLLNSVTQEQLEGISNYFAPASTSATTSGAGDVLAGATMSASPTAMLAESTSPSVTIDLPPPKAGTGPSDSEEQTEDMSGSVSQDEAEEMMQKMEEEQFQEAEKMIREAIEDLPEFQQLVESLVIDSTPEGLRIQIVDQDGLAMFPSGSAQMLDHTRKMMKLVTRVVKGMPQKIAVTGHTDARKFSGGVHGYTNWELSADRANASRRALIELGIDPKRLARVVGMAAQEPFVADDPNSARNRRISIVLLRGTGDQKAPPPKESEGAKEAAEEVPKEAAE